MRKDYKSYKNFYEDRTDVAEGLQEYDASKKSTMLPLSDTHKNIINAFKSMKIKTTADTKLLDLGSNDGLFTSDLSKEFNIKKDNTYCVDISKKATDIVKKRGFNAINMDLDTDTNLPIKDNSIDIAFVGCVIPHLVNPDHAINELHRVLKIGGIVGINVPNAASWYNRLGVLLGKSITCTDASMNYTFDSFFFNEISGHLRMYTVRSLTSLMKVHGFSIEKVVGIGINTKIGIGKKFKFITKAVNFVFFKPTLSSYILVIASKK